MKTKALPFLMLLFVAFTSCNNDSGTDYEKVKVASAEIMSFEALRTSVAILPPQPIEESGKIYVRENIVLINDKAEGIHVIDNSNPANPQKIAFIKIPGNNDMELKGNYLYADSYIDLVVFDVTDFSNVKEVERLENVFPYYPTFPSLPEEDVLIDYSTYPAHSGGIVVGWDIKTELREVVEDGSMYYSLADAMEVANVAPSTGQGGSLARFKIVSDYLYAVDSHNINVFDISNLEAPQEKEKVYAGFDIETIFNRGNHLFLGSMSGMYIYDIENPAAPTYVSEFMHGTACDPVVVDGDYAYITLRGGNQCGATESGLFVVDISDIVNPVEKASYSLKEPYGLGVMGDRLYVCDGSEGLKVFDKTDVMDIQMLNKYETAKTYDVIPMESHLLMIGENKFYQYNYEENGLSLISEFSLN
ncbi:hypothetical protein OOZ15_08540 [Galbibacter sp. EGI 63066]|uniref:LVIVD repeat-containing protein n=1 Tax=Galbibacter sp. EGI 63066 TaxID=2993559 RepID=UPI0022487DB6|nr:hypothetical protein [Galbibacter sp. EGI 63066]MCX2679981.1 hypothetical protein [Galbibacter sp. EGI 63066]